MNPDIFNMSAVGLRITLIFFSSFVFSSAFEQECSANRQRNCRSVIQEKLAKNSRDLSSEELEKHCRAIGQNVDCLVWQLAQCSKVEGRERSGDTLWRAWKYMQHVCSKEYGWWQSSCLHTDEVKECEKLLTSDDSSITRSSCLEFRRFRDCVFDAVKRQCEPEDTYVLGIYLLDKAKERVWRCPWRKASTNVTHEKLSSYTSSLTIDSPFSSGCNARATEEMRGCLDRFQYERDQSMGYRDGEDRLKRSCCATWNYRHCVQSAVRSHCYDAREIESAPTIDGVGHDRDFYCREHWVYTCSGASAVATATAASFAFLLAHFAVIICIP